MKSAIIFFVILLSANAAFAQNVFNVTIKNEETKQAVEKATVSVKDTEISAETDANGRVSLENIPNGEQTIEIFSPGYETKEIRLTFPLGKSNGTINNLYCRQQRSRRSRHKFDENRKRNRRFADSRRSDRRRRSR